MGDRVEHWGATVLLCLFLLASFGCASFTQPETPAQALAYADSQFTALVETAADLREQGVVDEQDAAEITPIIRKGDEALTMAWAALAQDRPEDALGYVSVVNRLLTQLSQHLQEARNDDGTGN